MSICEICEKEFNQLQGRNRKNCPYCNVKIRRHTNLLALVEFLGGKCIKCGYDENPIALQFHHRDSKIKKFTIGCVANKSFKVLLEEAKKCDLLCANCHTIEHSKRENPKFIEAVKNYKGKQLI